ncbi:enoyl-CoA-hydratase DpgB [Streptomyces sp. NPDC058464]|uniref:enoyl-CoA-hydratase DpgB n=1 Tax=Streptomyces sp. NPDC058464 TaxID=3346511 RepID=UPI00365CD9AA
MVTPETDALVVRVDGRRPLSTELVAAFEALCDRAEDRTGRNTVIVHVSGAPAAPAPGNLTIALVSKWERALRRFERLPAATVAVASDECGGVALEALLATDYRIGTASLRLLMAGGAAATWPGMALYRIVRQAGSAAARRAVLLGIPLTAADALAAHLVDEVTADAATALTAATELTAAVPGPELAIRRQLMHDATAVSFEEALGAHLAACDRALRLAAAETGR